MKKKLIIIFGIVILLTLIIILNLNQHGGYKKVELYEAKVGSIVSKVSASGEIKACKEVKIYSDILGRIKKLYVEAGNFVNSGDTLFSIHSDELEIALAHAKTRFDYANANFKRAETNFEQKKALYEKTLIPKSEYLEAETDLKLNLAKLEEAKIDVAQASSNLKKAYVLSPIAGKVIEVNVEEGELVFGTKTNIQTIPLTSIADLSAFFVDTKVNEADIVNIKPGQKTTIKLNALPRATLDGKVIGAHGRIQPQEGKEFKVRIGLLNPPSCLIPGISADVEIDIDATDSVIVIPLEAVVTKDDTEKVFIAKDNIANLISIKTGISDGINIEIKEGLNSGDKIIVGPFKVLRTLKDGDKVKKL